jgi:hypothetical protein
MMLMNFETNDKYCFCSFFLLFVYFCSNICTGLLFFETRCCHTLGNQENCEGVSFLRQLF